MTYAVPRVGISILIIKDQKDILLGKRKGAHGEGEWALPGGKQEFGETVFETADRELMEECGPKLKVARQRVLCIGDLTAYKGKHFLDVTIACTYMGGDPVVKELDKCEEWQWFNMANLPSPLFAPIKSIVGAHLYGYNYWEK
ncbi:phosphatase [Streptomyces phage PinkiePie]|nr:hydrolase [Streptomyces phage Bartholomune]UOW93460.1 MutT-like nucleotide pyrophosphohydrolase [Streptomyces phage Squillium]WNM73292.1 MutT-like nucleotide pyrophosphohydrolase [Streptomyces phage Liandry]WNM74690.1 phosphatase [Streptomyces phage PinkiePie]